MTDENIESPEETPRRKWTAPELVRMNISSATKTGVIPMSGFEDAPVYNLS